MSDFQQDFAAGAAAMREAAARKVNRCCLNILTCHAASAIRTLPIPAAAADPDFTAGIEAMRAALVEYFRVWPRDRMTADFISKFEVPSHFLRSDAAPAESEESDGPSSSDMAHSLVGATDVGKVDQSSMTPPLSASEPAGATALETALKHHSENIWGAAPEPPGAITEAQATDMIAEGLKRPHPPAGVIEWPDAYAFDHRRAEPSEEDVAVLIATLRSQLETDRTIARAVLALLRRGKE